MSGPGLLPTLDALAAEWERVRCGVMSPGLRRAAADLREVAQRIKADDDDADRNDYAAWLNRTRPLPPAEPDGGER